MKDHERPMSHKPDEDDDDRRFGQPHYGHDPNEATVDFGDIPFEQQMEKIETAILDRQTREKSWSEFLLRKLRGLF